MRLIVLLAVLLGFTLNSFAGVSDYVVCIHTGGKGHIHVEKLDLKDVSEEELHIKLFGDKFVKLSLEKDVNLLSVGLSDIKPVYGKYLKDYSHRPVRESLKPPLITLINSVKLII